MRKKVIISILVLLVVVLAGALTYHLTREETLSSKFLSQLDKGEVKLKKLSLYPANTEQSKTLFKKYQEKYPNFKREFWFVPTMENETYIYSVFYDWTNRSCTLKINDQYSKTELFSEPLAVKYCEKAYGVKI